MVVYIGTKSHIKMYLTLTNTKQTVSHNSELNFKKGKL